ncbi:MAG TPA: hypothetical protein VF435_18010 [Pyrinomonadaceae bacterium]
MLNFDLADQLRLLVNSHVFSIPVLIVGGVHNVVCFGDSPACVSEDIIDLIRARIDQNGFVKAHNYLKPGDRVVISAGPLKT